jgi:tetratricopeptide (TPR) repeat protein
MRVLIAASPKTGSTALAYHIKAALPDHQLYFEPLSLSRVPDSSDKVIVKHIYPVTPGELAKYDRPIILVRHPFDIVVSFALFATTSDVALVDKITLNNYFTIHRVQQGVPGARFLDVCEPRMQRLRENIFSPLLATNDLFSARRDQALLLHYEEMSAGELSSVWSYLGRSQGCDAILPPEHSFVARTRGFGDWKNWFTEDDVEFFGALPAIRGYAENFGYDLTFDPHHVKEIREESGCAYFVKAVNMTRMRWGVPSFVPDEPRDIPGSEAFLASARAQEERTKPELALEKAIVAILSAPSNPAYLNNLGRCCYISEQYEAAQTALAAAIEEEPGLAFSWTLLAGCYARAGKPSKALSALQKAGSLAPESINEHFGHTDRIIVLGRQIGDQRPAEEWLRRIITKQARPEYHTRLAEVLMDLGRGEQALIEIETALERGDAGVRAYRMKSRILYSLGRLPEAMTSVVRALQCDRNDTSTQGVLREIETALREYNGVSTPQQSTSRSP